MNITKQIKEIEKEFEREFTYDVLYSASSDLSSGKGIAFKSENPSAEKVKKFLHSSLLSISRATVERVREELKKKIGIVRYDMSIEGSIGYEKCSLDILSSLSEVEKEIIN